MLNDDGCHILEDVPAKYGLDHEQIGVPVHTLFYNAQVVDVSVPVEVQVGNHVSGVVEKDLELPYIAGLCECCSYSLKVKLEAVVVVLGIYGCSCYSV